jgi:cytoskeletal protein RodZ
MDRWTRASRLAALVAGAITCLVVGMLVGVLASGGHPHNVLQVITDPAPPASAHDLQPKSRNKPTLPTQSPTTVTSTTIVTASAKTVTTPTQTVTETETQTVTEPTPTTTPQTTSP